MSVNYVLRQTKGTNFLSVQAKPPDEPPNEPPSGQLHHAGTQKCIEKIQEIVELLDCPYRLNVTEEFSNRKIPNWNIDYYPTKIKWQSAKYRQICYQFDGKSSNRAKNPSNDELNKILNAFPGYKLIQLGNHLTLKQCIEIAARSDCFMGCCSGMSHLCHSVGVPMFLFQYQMKIEKWHKNKKYILCEGTKDGIQKVKEYLNA
jgi:hypothetical protein